MTRNRILFVASLFLAVLGISTNVYAYMIASKSVLNSDLRDDVYKLSIPVYKGWNLIPSLSVDSWKGKDGKEVVTSRQILPESEITTENIKAIFYYSPSQRKYFTQYKDVQAADEAAAQDLAALGVDHNDNRSTKWYNYRQTSAVWLYSNKSGILSYEISGNDTSGDTKRIMNNRKLHAGWNFIVVTPEMSGKSFEDVKGSCNLEKMYAFNAEQQNWINLSADQIKDAVAVGLIVKVSEHCQLGAQQTVISPPPELP